MRIRIGTGKVNIPFWVKPILFIIGIIEGINLLKEIKKEVKAGGIIDISQEINK